MKHLAIVFSLISLSLYGQKNPTQKVVDFLTPRIDSISTDGEYITRTFELSWSQGYDMIDLMIESDANCWFAFKRKDIKEYLEINGEEYDKKFDGKTSAFCDCHFDDYFLFIWIMKNGLTHGSLVTYIGEE